MAFRSWEKIEIGTEQGAKETAIAPLIISASRSPDLVRRNRRNISPESETILSG